MARTRHLHRAGVRFSLSWSLRNEVAQARHLDRAAAPPTKSFLIKKGGRGRAMQRVRPRESQRHVSGNGRKEDLIHKSGTSRKQHAYKSSANRSHTGGKKHSVEDKSPINKEYMSKFSQKTPTVEQMALLKKSTPNGYLISRGNSSSRKSETKKGEVVWPS
ncbi:hypothetical protein PIB30_079949, partial [Stylosanthes scabra]|nr:hypothetical protein [Stylosanthes scabra]